MNRWKASGIHFSISLVVLTTITIVVIWRWYPPAIFHTVQADRLLLILAGVDVVVGPLLTLLVYKHGKKSLKFDLSVIVMLQLAALGYGLHALWQSRPVYLVAATDRFQLVFANEIDRQDLQWAKPEFQQLPLFGIETIAAVVPVDSERRMQALQSAIAGKDIYLIPVHYEPYAAAADDLLRKATPAVQFATSLAPDQRRLLQATMADIGMQAASVVIVPIDSTRGSATMLLNAHNGDPLQPVAIDPWPILGAIPDRK